MAKSEARIPDDPEDRTLSNGGEVLKSPCMDCPDRHLRCHSSCGDYAAFHEQRTAINNARAALGFMDEYDNRNRTRAIRKARKNRW